MILPVFNIKFLELPDDKLAIHLWAWWIGYHAEINGVELTKDFATRLLEETREKLDTNVIKNIALEKALKKIAQGDAAGGGKLFREYMLDGAYRLKNEYLAEVGLREKTGKKKGGTKAGEVSAKKKKENFAKVMAAKEIITSQLRNNLSDNELAKRISEKTNIAQSTVRRYLKELASDSSK